MEFKLADLEKEYEIISGEVFGVEQTDEYDSYYDEDGVPLLEVLKYDNKTVLWFKMTNNKYEFDRKHEVIENVLS